MVYKEKNELRRMNKEERMKPLPDYDLSLVPYFVRKPGKGEGVKEVLRRVYREEQEKVRCTKVVQKRLLRCFCLFFFRIKFS